MIQLIKLWYLLFDDMAKAFCYGSYFQEYASALNWVNRFVSLAETQVIYVIFCNLYEYLLIFDICLFVYSQVSISVAYAFYK